MGLVETIAQAGVVGAGGAGFPTHIKASGRAEIVIANGAECEPVLVTDQWIAALYPQEVVSGLVAMAEAVCANRAVLAFKRKYHHVVERVRPYADKAGVEIFLLDDFYPAGDEHVLVHEVTKRVVPEGGIPLDVGVVVNNVGTLRNVALALRNIPVTMKHITVAGEVAQPGVYEAPIGTSALEVIAAAGGATVDDFRVIEGGPMMGPLVLEDQVVTKTTSGYIVLKADHPVVSRKSRKRETEMRWAMSTCCGCRACTELCPRAQLGHRVFPHAVMRAVHAGMENSPQVLSTLVLCSQCGVCEAYACTMGLSPKAVIAELRNRLTPARSAFRARPDRPQSSQAWARVPKPRLTERLCLETYLLEGSGVPKPVPTPWEVTIPLKQHIGAPAVATVAPGQKVMASDCIGEVPQGTLGARVHASIDGVVTFVDSYVVRIARR